MDKQSISVLLVEDDTGEANLTRRALSGIRAPSFEIECASTLGEAIEKATARAYDVALLDQGLPDSISNETLPRFRQAMRDALPVIVLTGLDDEQRAARGG